MISTADLFVEPLWWEELDEDIVYCRSTNLLEYEWEFVVE